MSLIIDQVKARMGELDSQFGRRKHPLTPHSPHPRDNRMRRDVFAKLRVPNAIEARIASKEAFASGSGSYASLLVCRTSAVIEAFMFEGQPGMRAALVDLAAFALVLAETITATPTTTQRQAP